MHSKRIKPVRIALATSNSTPNGWDKRWLPVINQVLEDRDSDLRITDLDDDLWERFIGPLVDAIEDGDCDPALVITR